MLENIIEPYNPPTRRMPKIVNTCWQKKSRKLSSADENRINDALVRFFEGTEYTYIKNPRKLFKNFYMDGPVTDKDVTEMYHPEKGLRSLDMEPDGIIINNRTGKSIIIEHKRQNGMTEGRASDNRTGNQYERAGRYLMPGVRHRLTKMCGLDESVTPFVLIVTGPVTREERHVRILRTMFDVPGAENNVYLWRENEPEHFLTKHIKEHILPFLE